MSFYCHIYHWTGWRVGKAAGFTDMEFAMTISLGVALVNVPIVAVAHDCQVLDLPSHLFGEHLGWSLRTNK